MDTVRPCKDNLAACKQHNLRTIASGIGGARADGFRGLDLGFRIWGFRFRLSDNLRLRICMLEFWMSGSKQLRWVDGLFPQGGQVASESKMY